MVADLSRLIEPLRAVIVAPENLDKSAAKTV